MLALAPQLQALWKPFHSYRWHTSDYIMMPKKYRTTVNHSFPEPSNQVRSIDPCEHDNVQFDTSFQGPLHEISSRWTFLSKAKSKVNHMLHRENKPPILSAVAGTAALPQQVVSSATPQQVCLACASDAPSTPQRTHCCPGDRQQ